jgi:hypothetical protein
MKLHLVCLLSLCHEIASCLLSKTIRKSMKCTPQVRYQYRSTPSKPVRMISISVYTSLVFVCACKCSNPRHHKTKTQCDKRRGIASNHTHMPSGCSRRNLLVHPQMPFRKKTNKSKAFHGTLCNCIFRTEHFSVVCTPCSLLLN